MKDILMKFAKLGKLPRCTITHQLTFGQLFQRSFMLTVEIPIMDIMATHQSYEFTLSNKKKKQ